MGKGKGMTEEKREEREWGYSIPSHVGPKKEKLNKKRRKRNKKKLKPGRYGKGRPSVTARHFLFQYVPIRKQHL